MTPHSGLCAVARDKTDHLRPPRRRKTAKALAIIQPGQPECAYPLNTIRVRSGHSGWHNGTAMALGQPGHNV